MSGQTQTPRIVPTAPGWWWAKGHGTPIRVQRAPSFDGGEALYGFSTGSSLRVADPLWDWLAPIPDPATCAALAEAGNPSPEVLRALGRYMRAVLGRGPKQAGGVNVRDALSALDDAIRAARVAGAEGGGE